MTEHIDLLITGGTLVDGSGAPGRAGTVSVVDERLRILGPSEPFPEQVVRTIDASGKVVAPGFIDLYSHGAWSP
jgi:N-acyl-D-amino-acid deacylase